MPQIAEPTAVGGLVVLNGRHEGTRVPLRLPVTVIGSGPGCDVRLAAAGVGEVHCVVVATPAGPAVRSLFPGSTRRNGAPTAAALLRNGDELTVGPCALRFAWAGGGPAGEAEAVEPPAARPAAADFHLREREQAVHEQERQLAALVEERQKHVQGLLDQLADGREQLRGERAAAAADRADARAKADEARRLAAARQADRARTRKAAARLLRRTRNHCAAELAAARAERAAAVRERRAVAAEQARLAAERDRLRAAAEEHAARLTDAWGMVAAAQDRLAADRQESERELSRLFQLLDARSAAAEEARQKLATGEARLAADRRAFEEECRAARDEVAGLERRAFHLRLAVQELEQQRAAAAADDPGFVPEALPVPDAVPLDAADGRSADELLTLLLHREQELDRERAAVAAARADLDRLAGDLADQRAVLAERFEELAAARRAWQEIGTGTAEELEAAARELADRERAVAEREEATARADAARRDRERDVWRLQAQLDRWQAALAAHEARAAADAERAAAELATRWGKLTDREVTLAAVCRAWHEARCRERDDLRAELTRWADDQAAAAAARAGLDRERETWLADAARVAGLAVALEEARQAWEKATGSRRAARRLRVLRKRWEGRFRRYAADLARRREKLAAEAAALDDRHCELHRLLASAAERTAELAEERQALDRARLAAAPAGDEPVMLSPADTRAGGDDELAAVRAEAERLAAGLRGADERADILPLRAA